jgi:glutamate dehydrogenase (NAD(P)+)
VTVSYFEWVQNITGFPWLFEKEVDERLTYTMETNAEEVFKMAQKYNVHNRLGAYLLAIDRLAKAMRLRGQQ